MKTKKHVVLVVNQGIEEENLINICNMYYLFLLILETMGLKIWKQDYSIIFYLFGFYDMYSPIRLLVFVPFLIFLSKNKKRNRN